MHKRRPTLVSLAVLPILFMATGCGGGPQAQATVTATVTAAPPAPAAGNRAEPSADGTPQAQAAPKASWSKPARPTPAIPVLEDFRGLDQEGYFFTSPSGNLLCGFHEFGLVGCQAQSPVANLPACDDPMATSGPEISMYPSGQASANCSSEGVFVDSAARVLHYGQHLTVGAITCSSTETGVHCTNELSGAGFSASKQGFTPHG